jgi:Retrotransposon gag protein
MQYGRTGDSYQQFLNKLDKIFADPHEERQAKEAITHIRQGSDRAETFFAKFEIAQREAGYDNIFHEDYIINLLYKALNYKIVEWIFSIHPLPTSFKDWKHHAIQIDQNIHMFKDITQSNY